MRRTSAAAASIFAVVASTLAACSPLVALNAVMVPHDGWRAERGIAYGAGDRRQLDVYMPVAASGPAPVVLFFYGGSWRGGSRAYYRFVGEALTSRGYVVVIPDYRVYPEVRFPAFVEDGAAAVAWVRANIASRGGDPDRLFLMGHSAGAYIAALLASDEYYLRDAGVEPGAIRGLIGLAGPYAIDPSQYSDIRPIFAGARAVEVTQPIRFVDGSEPPMLLFYGADDETVFPTNTLAFAERVRTAGGSVQVREIPDTGHIRLVLALAEPFRHPGGVLDEVDRFLREQAGGAGEPRRK